MAVMNLCYTLGFKAQVGGCVGILVGHQNPFELLFDVVVAVPHAKT